MNIQEMITIMQLEANAKVVKARYTNGNAPVRPQRPPSQRDTDMPYSQDDAQTGYHFKNVVGLNLEVGDLIVCETHGSFQLLEVLNPDVMVTEVSCEISDLKHVVAKVRNDDYLAVKEAENEAHRKLALSEVTSRLDKYKTQVDNGTFEAVAGLLGTKEPDKVDEAEVVEG